MRVTARAAMPLILLAALLFSINTQAHQQKAGLSHVLFNPRTGNIEVMHRFYIHDAEHAVRQIFDPKADILASAETAEQFAQYVQERFSLLDTDGSPLKLGYVGQEQDSGFIWVYQETPIPQSLSGLSVVNNILRDVWEQQSNLVNIERSGTIQSLDFSANVQWLSVSFDE
ncbi:MAG: DUF6702 family protein [Pseudohongiellaceae bacterium]|nr:DUF6702 family protein [Pseudohongiellaceae bacterium]